MRRLFRLAFNLCAALSALLLVGVCVLWVRSYRSPWGSLLPKAAPAAKGSA